MLASVLYSLSTLKKGRLTMPGGYEPRGLKSLVHSEKAELARLSAKHLRATAGPYSTEYDWVQKNYEAANKADLDAYYYKRRAIEG